MMQVDNLGGELGYDSIARQHVRLDITSYADTIDAIDAIIGIDANSLRFLQTSSQNAA